MSPDPAITSLLARFVAESRWQDIPPDVRHEAKRSLLNWLGCALGGCRDDAVERALGVLIELGAPPQATVIGRTERLDPLGAAFVNAVSSNVFDFDDTHLRTVIHPSAPVLPALLALAEQRAVTGSALLHAFVLGAEVECRIGNAMSPGHYDRGWHITGTCGVLGAAAASAKLLGLDAQGTAWALGNAATQAGGLVESLGVMAKSINVGNAARNGCFSALLAARGFTGAELAIEGPRGYLRVMSEAPDAAAITTALGEEWELRLNTYKPYPCGVVLHPVIDACLALRERHALGAEAIERVTVRGNPLLRARTDRRAPRTGREAQVSAQHSVGVSFLLGRAGVAEYSDALARDPRVLALGERVEIIEDAAVPVAAAFVAVRTRGGERYEEHVPHASGSVGRPLTDAQIEAKFRALARHGAPAADASSLIAAAWDIEAAEGVASLLHA